MTLKRKILFRIYILTFLLILAMSGTYYQLFIREIRENSQKQIVMAFELIFDDLSNQVNNVLPKITEFVETSLISPMMTFQLLQDEYNQTEQAWTIWNVKKLLAHLSTIAGNVQQFGGLIDAVEILLFDKHQQLFALYQQLEEEVSTGIYLARLHEHALIPIQADAKWHIMLRAIEDIPYQALPEDIPLHYEAEIPSSINVTLSTINNKLVTIKFITPLVRNEAIEGVCVVQIGIHQAALERYSRLSQTTVNLFTDNTLIAGTLPEYTTIVNSSQPYPHPRIDLLSVSALPQISFSQETIGAQSYYQGMLAVNYGGENAVAITVNFPRTLEEERKKQFFIIAAGITLIFSILAAIEAFGLSASIIRPITQITKVIQKLAEGDLIGVSPDSIGKPGTLYFKLFRKNSQRSFPDDQAKDELGRLSLSSQKMVTYLQEMATLARHISQGEIIQTITPRSTRDVLGHAFHEMTEYLHKIAAVATEMSTGDLRRKVAPKTEHDVLGKAFQQLTALRDVMEQIRKEADRLGNAAIELNNVSIQMANDAQHASQHVRDVSANSKQVSQNMTEIATSTEQLSVSTGEISRNANEVANMLTNAVKIANTAKETIVDLEGHSREIGEIITVITAITQQTNLLALNATIEAARAGEYGKGFAVVANEVKNLAMETAKSAKDIIGKVEAIQVSRQHVTDAINELSAFIEQIHNFTNSIVSAVEEQTVTATVIAQNTASAAEGSNGVASAIADVSTVAQNISERAAHVRDAAENSASVAEQLQQLVGKFNI